VTGSREHSEPCGSVKVKEFPDKLSDSRLPKKHSASCS
jgi:hypothetical protein